MTAGVPIPKFASVWARRFANFGIDEDVRAVECFGAVYELEVRNVLAANIGRTSSSRAGRGANGDLRILV